MAFNLRTFEDKVPEGTYSFKHKDMSFPLCCEEGDLVVITLDEADEDNLNKFYDKKKDDPIRRFDLTMNITVHVIDRDDKTVSEKFLIRTSAATVRAALADGERADTREIRDAIMKDAIGESVVAKVSKKNAAGNARYLNGVSDDELDLAQDAMDAFLAASEEPPF